MDTANTPHDDDDDDNDDEEPGVTGQLESVTKLARGDEADATSKDATSSDAANDSELANPIRVVPLASRPPSYPQDPGATSSQQPTPKRPMHLFGLGKNPAGSSGSE